MIGKLVSCFIALVLATLVQGDKHVELLDRGYEYIEGVGYYYFATGRNWTYAQDDCMSTKARLTVIDSEEELQAVVSFLSNHTKEAYSFVGYRNKHESQYVTIEGFPLKRTAYSKWEAGKPSGSADGCVGINTKTGELSDLSCDDPISYVCEHQLWTDYIYSEGIGHYKLHAEGKGWADAYATCESEGAHLLIINSQAEADAVMQIYNLYPHLPNADSDDLVYLGFRAVVENLIDKEDAGTYLTIFGTSVSDLGYVKWYSGQPFAANYYYCGTLFRNGATYYMVLCSDKMAFICEREIQEFSSP